MPLITICGGDVLVHTGRVRTCGRTLNRATLYVAGEVIPEGSLGIDGPVWGTPIERVQQLTLEQGRTITHVLKGDH